MISSGVKQSSGLDEKRGQPVRIVDYSPAYGEAFKSLNARWINEYFTMEPSDVVLLDDPQGMIIDRGGAIFVALSGNDVVGVCALVPESRSTFQLAKMAVAPEAQGRGIGRMLGVAVLDRARSLGASEVILFTNDVLAPAMALYHSLGFVRVAHEGAEHVRSNTKMSFRLS